MKKVNLSELSPRQLEIALMLAQGLSNGDIAKKLGLSYSTIRHNNEMIFLKIGAENRTQAALIIAGVL
jgi:DNA-binding NarL/FixJ family response regulator